jgi:hypothetical protein
MLYINPRVEKSNPETFVNPTKAYPDTLEAFFSACKKPPQHLFDDIGLRVEPCEVLGKLWGVRAYLNTPSFNQIIRFDRLIFKYDGTLHRVDIAFDNDHSLTESFEQHAMLRRRRSGPMDDVEGTTYWVKLGKKSPRQLLCYPDEECRIQPGSGYPVLHVELRFIGADCVRRQPRGEGRIASGPHA